MVDTKRSLNGYQLLDENDRRFIELCDGYGFDMSTFLAYLNNIPVLAERVGGKLVVSEV